MEKILITGASSGIGKELARNLAGRSRKMYLLARSEDKLNLLKKELEEKNSLLECTCIKYDLNDIEQLEKITENCDVDLVINCAGIGKITDFLKLSDEEDLNTVNVNSAKSALLHYSLALDEELSHKNKNVRVLSVCPGPTASNFFDKDTQEKFGNSQKFMMTSECAAKEIIKMIEKKKRFSIIGFRNRLSMFLINLLPVSLQLKLTGLILKKVIK